MARLTAIFIAICMVAISVSLGVALYLRFGFELGESAAIGLGAMVLMSIVHFSSMRARDREYASRRVARLAVQVERLAGEVANVEHRVTALEASPEEEPGDSMDGETLKAALAEIEILGGLVRQLAEAVTAIDEKFESQAADRIAAQAAAQAARQATVQPSPPPAPEPATAAEPARKPRKTAPVDTARKAAKRAEVGDEEPGEEARPAAKSAGSEEARKAASVDSGMDYFEDLDDDDEVEAPVPARRKKPKKPTPPDLPAANPLYAKMPEDELRDLVHEAIRARRIELFIQPIVSLPQRRTVYHEALSRLRTEDGDLLAPADFLRIAEPDGLMPAIDNQLLLRAIPVVRRLISRNKKTALFCNVSPLSLGDTRFFNQFIEFMERNSDLAQHLVFEFPQRGLNQLGPVEFEGLDALRELGFRLSVDRIVESRLDLKELSGRGFRFAKISASALLDGVVDMGGDIHPADLSDLCGRHNITLIADRIESENQIVNIIDYEIALGQGRLFSEPRPVRDEPAARERRGQAAAE